MEFLTRGYKISSISYQKWFCPKAIFWILKTGMARCLQKWFLENIVLIKKGHNGTCLPIYFKKKIYRCWFGWRCIILCVTKGGIMSEDAGKFSLFQKNIPNLYPEQKIWIICLLLWVGNVNFLLRIVIWNIFLEK